MTFDNSNHVSRTQTEVIDRINAIENDDMWGFRSEVLIDALDYVHAKQHISEDVTEDDWVRRSVRVRGVEHTARDYLEFAVSKIEDHRGLSASRSVDKLGEYAWLLGRDDIVEAMNTADYPQYGAPKIMAFATGMGWEITDSPELQNMGDGRPCTPDCDRGCGQ